jgi:hypothetical protein
VIFTITFKTNFGTRLKPGRKQGFGSGIRIGRRGRSNHGIKFIKSKVDIGTVIESYKILVVQRSKGSREAKRDRHDSTLLGLRVRTPKEKSCTRWIGFGHWGRIVGVETHKNATIIGEAKQIGCVTTRIQLVISSDIDTACSRIIKF